MTRVFVAGATGAVARRLVQGRVDGRYDVIAMTRSRRRTDAHSAHAPCRFSPITSSGWRS